MKTLEVLARHVVPLSILASHLKHRNLNRLGFHLVVSSFVELLLGWNYKIGILLWILFHLFIGWERRNQDYEYRWLSLFYLWLCFIAWICYTRDPSHGLRVTEFYLILLPLCLSLCGENILITQQLAETSSGMRVNAGGILEGETKKISGICWIRMSIVLTKLVYWVAPITVK